METFLSILTKQDQKDIILSDVAPEQKPASNPEAIKSILDQWLSQLKPFPSWWIITTNGEDRFVPGKSIQLDPDGTGEDNSLFIRPAGVFKAKLVRHLLPTGKFEMVPDENTFNIASPEDYARYEDQIRKAIIQAQIDQSYGIQP
jgi:hypothetical protein